MICLWNVNIYTVGYSISNSAVLADQGGKRMNRRLHSAAATGALIACCVCHVWTWLQVLRAYFGLEEQMEYTGPGLSCVVLYMAAVCLFNWHALKSESRAYRRMALVVTAFHLGAALLQGAAAEAVLLAGQGREGWVMTVGVILPAVLNLPMDSTQVIRQLGSLIPWWTSLFFAANLVVVLLRRRRIPGME